MKLRYSCDTEIKTERGNIMYEFYKNMEITYVDSPYLTKNQFLNAEAHRVELPTYQNVSHLLPRIYWNGHEAEVACYNKAWEIAFSNLNNPEPGSGFVSPFIDTAFNGNLFMWDSSFILMFAKYASRAFDFQQTLDNFYSHQHKDGFISREIREKDGAEVYARLDPSSTGPAILSWCEYEYYLYSGDKSRLKNVYYPLLAYHMWMKKNRTWRNGTYFLSGLGCGMDNSPRQERDCNPRYEHGHMIWIDACFQALIDCDMLLKIAAISGIDVGVAELKAEKEALGNYINQNLWDEETGFYYDMYRDNRLSGVKTIASFWSLLTGIVPNERVTRLVAHLENENEFKRPHRVPSLSYDHSLYHPEGDYWRGSVWAPTTYMVLRGLDRCGYSKEAYDIALNTLENIVKVFVETGTFWEDYAPEKPAQGNLAKDNFIGWTGLVPISILIEYVFGIRCNALEKTIEWNMYLDGEYGIDNLAFGEANVSLKHNADGTVDIKTDKPITVKLIQNGKTEIRNCVPNI